MIILVTASFLTFHLIAKLQFVFTVNDDRS